MTGPGRGLSPDDEPVYGALARAEALAAGDPDWMNVTRWPREPGRVSSPPPCADECRKVLIDGMAGIEVHVTHVPPIVPPRYEPLNMCCPHGVLWFMEPTGEQIVRYASEGVE